MKLWLQTKMQHLDLHGLRHHEVQPMVEDFILEYQLPVKIITGNSVPMQEIVKQIVDRYDLSWDYESYSMMLQFVVSEKRI